MKQRILDHFAQHQDRYLSGEELSERLQCSRTAIWKHIQELKKRGYQFESSPRKGYRLIHRPDRFDPKHIMAELEGIDLYRDLTVHERLDSTQSEAHRLAAALAPHGTLIIAEEQTAGRGRQGKAWHSPAGKGIWLSLLIRPDLPIAAAPQLTLLTAVALCRTIRHSVHLPIGIKWPNDLLIDSKKVSGILVESVGEDEQVRYAAIGVGIDCNLTQDDYPQELLPVATSLSIESGRSVNRTALLIAFLKEFAALYKLYLDAGFPPIQTLWETLSTTLGKQVRLKQGDTRIEGIAEALDESGALLVRQEDGSLERIYSGEIIS